MPQPSVYGFQESGDYVGSFKRPEVADAKLKNYVVAIYKGDLRSNVKGTGSTMDAARWESKTGELLNGTDHLNKKAPELINGLTKWINKYKNASKSDINAAKNMLNDLQNAIVGKKNAK